MDWIDKAAASMNGDWKQKAANSVEENASVQLDTTLASALEYQPADHAQTQNVAKGLNIGVGLADREKDKTRKIYNQQEIRRKLKDTKAVKKAFADPEFARVAHGDVNQLSKAETIAEKFKILSEAGEGRELKMGNIHPLVGLAGATQATLGMAESEFRSLDPLKRIDELTENIGRDLGLPEWMLAPAIPVERGLLDILTTGVDIGDYHAAGLEDVADAIGQAQEILTQEFEPFKRLAEKGREADDAFAQALKGDFEALGRVVADPEAWAGFVGQAAPSLFAAYKSGGSLPFIAWLESMEVANDAADFEKRTGQKMEPGLYLQAMGQVAMINTFLEKFGLDKVFGQSGKNVFSGFLKGAVSEGGTEGLQNLNTNLAKMLSFNPEQDLTEGTLASIMGGFGAGGGAGAMTTMMQTENAFNADMMKAQKALESNEVMSEIVDTVLDMDMREHSPEQVKKFLKEDLGVEDSVYLDAKDAVEFFQTNPEVMEQMQESNPELANSVADAIGTGGQVNIPIADYAVYMPEYHEQLQELLRNDADGFNIQETNHWMETGKEEFMEQAERVIEAQDESDQYRESADQVEQYWTDQLMATGRFPEHVVGPYAAMHRAVATTIAARTGKMPHEILAERMPTVRATPIAGAQLSQQTPEFQAWAEGSTAVDDQGELKTFYHGTSDDIQAFDKEKLQSRDPGFLGQGVYITDAKAAADFYAESSERIRGGAPNVMPLYVNVKNTKTYNLSERVALYDEMLANPNFSEEHTAKLKAEGYDSAAVVDASGAIIDMVVFDEGSIRSAISTDQQLYQTAEEDLFVAHNLSAENIIAAQDLGGLAAPSLAVARTGVSDFTGFGEITLLADKDLLKDPKARTFDADIYSPRQPRPVYDVDYSKYREFEDQLDPDNLGLSTPDFQSIEDTNGADNLLRSTAVEYHWLKLQGKEPKLKNKKDIKPIIRKAAKFDLNATSLHSDERFIKMVTDHYQEILDDLSEDFDVRAEKMYEWYFNEDGSIKYAKIRDMASEVQRFRDTKGKDVSQLRDDISKKLRVKKTREAYQKWATETFNEMVTGKKIFKGFTPSGNRKYKPYNMQNVVKEMTQQLQAGESFFYGAGTVRSKYANEMKTIRQIQNKREEIVSEEDMEIVKKESGDVFWEAIEALKPYYKYDTSSFGYADDVGSAIIEGRSGMNEAFNMTPEAQKIVDDLLEYLTALPTSYFEAKVQRAVGFEEFNTAVVPKGMRKDALKILKDSGLKIKTYDPKAEGSRADTIAKQKQLLFQGEKQGAFSPESNIISLLEGANLSTFLHESGHFFLEMMNDYAQENAEVAKDMDKLLQWFGVADRSTWNNLTLEQQREHHEKFAEGFETYLFEGKAPSMELQGLFSQFRSWLMDVYRNIRQYLSPDKLTDEVRGVMDRMLATDVQIRQAETARSYFPLFNTEEEAKQYGVNWEEYQALAKDASDEAIQELDKRVLRDMKWMSNALSKQLRSLQREARAKRKAVKEQIIEEMDNYQVYAAIDFLKENKLSTKSVNELYGIDIAKPQAGSINPEIDDLFVAMAKHGGIDRAEAEAQGIDPANWGRGSSVNLPVPGAVALRVFKKDGGMSFDAMAEALSQDGYTSTEYSPNELLDLIDKQLAGDIQYSNQVNYDAITGRGEQEDIPDISKLRGLLSPKGMDVDEAAQLFAYSSGDAMVRDLANAQKKSAIVEEMTDQRMLELYGDVNSPGAMQAAAEEAIHNKVRQKFVANEYNALAKATGQKQVLNKAAKEFATNAINAKRIRDIKPAQYNAAEARAGRESDKAMRQGNTDEAATHKRSQLLNGHMFKAANNGLNSVDKMIRYLKKFQSKGTRKNIDPEYLEQIDAITANVDLRKGQSLKAIDRKNSLSEWIAKQKEDYLDPVIDEELIASIGNKHYKEMTLEELNGMVDTVKVIDHMGRFKQKMLTAKDKRDFAEVVDEMKASIDKYSKKRAVRRGKETDVVGRTAAGAREFVAMHRKMSSIIREMDGFEDGGIMWERFLLPANESANNETERKAQASEIFADLFEPIQPKLGKDGLPLNIKQFRKVVPGTDISMTREERVMTAMNWGNAGNRQRLMDGGTISKESITEQEVQAIIDTLTKEEMDFVQGVFDYYETFKPEIEAQELRLTGIKPEWLEPTPIQTKHGVYRGGYHPAKYDVMLSTRSESLEAKANLRLQTKGVFNSATTRDDYVQKRSAEVKDRPLMLTYDTISSRINEVIHRLSWEDYLVDANRMLKALDKPIRDHYGYNHLNELKETIKVIAEGDTPATNAWERGINHVRVGTTIVGMGLRFTTAAIQPTGIAQGWFRLGGAKNGGKWVAIGMKDYLKNPKKAYEDVVNESKMMKSRGRTMMREINEEMNKVRKGKRATELDATYFWMITKMQIMTVDMPLYLGAKAKFLAQLQYENAVDEQGRNEIEHKAIAMAEQVVLDSQSGGEVKDLARIQRGGPFLKLWTNFYSYFSATYNMNVENFKQRDLSLKHPSEIGLFMADFVILNIVPIVLSVLIREALKGDCDWEIDCMQKKAVSEGISYAAGQMIGVRELSNAIEYMVTGESYRYSGPPGIRVFKDFINLAQQTSKMEFDAKFWKSASIVGGQIFHLPTGQVNQTVEAMIDIANGRVKGGEAVQALLTGPQK